MVLVAEAKEKKMVSRSQDQAYILVHFMSLK